MTRPGRSRSSDARHDDHDARGTFVLMLVFLALIAAMWGWMYLTLLERG